MLLILVLFESYLTNFWEISGKAKGYSATFLVIGQKKSNPIEILISLIDYEEIKGKLYDFKNKFDIFRKD